MQRLRSVMRATALLARGPSILARRLHNDTLLDSYTGPQVLLVGEGDFGFSRWLAQKRPDLKITATTLDSKERLRLGFPQALENIAVLEARNVCVKYNVDATKLPQIEEFDTIAFNFPHIAGKQNIRKNRVLIQSFLDSARGALRKPGGKVIVLMCDSQAGTHALTSTDWKQSWMVTHAAAESNLLTVDATPVNIQHLKPLYSPIGRRGNLGSFSTYTGNNAIMLIFQETLSLASTGRRAVQAPLYAHEIHLLSPTLTRNTAQLEKDAYLVAQTVCASAGYPNTLWACRLVDVYVCPQTEQVSHALEMSYCGLDIPVGRTAADKIRLSMEALFVERLNAVHRHPAMLPAVDQPWTLRVAKLNGRCSHPHSWTVAEALRKRPRVQVCTDSPQLPLALASDRENYSNTAVEIQAVSRQLWCQRIGVIINELCEAEEGFAAQLKQQENQPVVSAVNLPSTHCVYLLNNTANHRTYLGTTSFAGLSKRLRQHNGKIPGGAHYTRMHGQGQWSVYSAVTRLNQLEAQRLLGMSRCEVQASRPIQQRAAALESLVKEHFPHAFITSDVDKLKQ